MLSEINGKPSMRWAANVIVEIGLLPEVATRYAQSGVDYPCRLDSNSSIIELLFGEARLLEQESLKIAMGDYALHCRSQCSNNPHVLIEGTKLTLLQRAGAL